MVSVDGVGYSLCLVVSGLLNRAMSCVPWLSRADTAVQLSNQLTYFWRGHTILKAVPA